MGAGGANSSPNTPHGWIAPQPARAISRLSRLTPNSTTSLRHRCGKRCGARGLPFDGKLRNIPPRLTEGGLASEAGSALDGGLQEIPAEIAHGSIASGGASVGAPLSPIPNKDSQSGLASGGAASDLSAIDRIFPGAEETQLDAIAANSALDVQAEGIKPGTKDALVVTAAGGEAFDGQLQEIDPELADGSLVSDGSALDGGAQQLPTVPSVAGTAARGSALGASPIIIEVPKVGAGLASTGAAQTGEPSKTMLSDKAAGIWDGIIGRGTGWRTEQDPPGHRSDAGRPGIAWGRV